MNRQHGGDLKSFREKYGRDPLDFSSNVSPLGVPAQIRDAIKTAAFEADQYPDPLCRALREKIAQKDGVPAAYVMAGAGAADVIYRVAAAIGPRKALLPVPSFSEYEHALDLTGCTYDYYLLKEENGFRIQQDFLDRIDEDADLVMLCEPNNPTGVLDERDFLDSVLAKCEQCDAWLVIDESFLDITDDPDAVTMAGRLQEGRKLLLLRSFTKMYAMAGVRLGYCLCADSDLLAKAGEQGPPWNVSNLAQAAGIAALAADEYKEKVRAMVRGERRFLFGELAALPLTVIPGAANYLFFRGPAGLTEALSEKGILIRDCSNYRGLSDGWYRVAVRTHEENEQLIEAMKEVVL